MFHWMFHVFVEETNELRKLLSLQKNYCNASQHSMLKRVDLLMNHFYSLILAAIHSRKLETFV